ncbi:WD repeat and HMG-box DNA-binding protein 1 [Boleophthalmus pectinirostris]|uniref:WD repeat and HMG-box DNA-binding protein 1 n=1 Tax=Boleophthalmus pectinirostris TaxID=150288 RepID=UPI002431CC58|nr:WD repeat and HMG-box DNA-binding protein 1 [Boleophthalmus pectinirostris]
MPCEKKPMRYGHSEGHTEVCFDHTGGFIVTCGSDGDVRIWEGLDDDDPRFITVGEKAYSLSLKGGRLATASSSNAVQLHTFPEGEPDGILTRFTTNATHVTFNAAGTRVAAGSRKASSSCDGSVVVWDIEEQRQVTRWNLLHKSNDVSNAKSLCRLEFQPGAGKFLAVPVEDKVHLYERDTWSHVTTLTDDIITQPVNVVSWSPCGKRLAAASVGGAIVIWDVGSKLCLERQKHEKGFSVCSVAWSPSGAQLVYTDTEGCVGLLDGVCQGPQGHSKPSESTAGRDFDDLFDGDEDGPMDEGESPRRPQADDDDIITPTGRVRNRAAFLEDDNSLDTGSLKLGGQKFPDDDDDGGSSIAPPAGPPVSLRPVYEGPMPTPPQRAFQPGSTPAHLTHRFMMWNSVGIVRGYNDEPENAIDVEFHDSAVHHGMHLSNALGHAIADISQEAVLLACPSTDQLASKLLCVHFSSWDTHKEWVVDLPRGEDARALCLGRGFVAVATSALLLRLFTIGGLQREVFSLSGNVVCVSAHGQQLCVVYHRGTGFDGDQALGVQLLSLSQKKRLILDQPLPLSPRSTLSWMGFTAEGTPCSVDSEGVVRMLNRSLGNTWTPVCNTRDTCKSKSDHYWVIGVHEEQFWRSVLLHHHFGFLSSSGFEVDHEAQSQSLREQQELLMKMFALSCKLDREFRCVELAQMMTQNVVTLAIKYASRSGKMRLAQRLSEIALEKTRDDEDDEEDREEEEEEEETRFSRSEVSRKNRRQTEEEEEEEEAEEPQHKRRMNPFAKDAAASPEKTVLKPVAVSRGARSNPFKVSSGGAAAAAAQPRVANILDNIPNRKSTPPTSSSSKTRKSPVLKPLAPKPKSKTQSTLLQLNSKTNTKRPEPEETPEEPRTKEPDPAPPSPESTENRRPQTGFQLWLENHRKNILAENPSLDETEVIKEAMGRFRNLTPEQRLSWAERAKTPSAKTSTADDPKKRKRPEEEGDEAGGEETNKETNKETNAKKTKTVGAAEKLSAFAFN